MIDDILIIITESGSILTENKARQPQGLLCEQEI
jgi:hypothetical protein